MHVVSVKGAYIKLKISLCFAFAIMCFVPLAASSAEAGLFQSIEFKGKSIKALPRWVRVLEKIAVEDPVIRLCSENSMYCETPALMAWRDFMHRYKNEKVSRTTLQDLNDFINQWVYTSDTANWGVRDYWASPLEFLKNSGDCEDYAIMKYVALKELGVAESDLRIVVVQDTVRDVAHAVLAVYLENEQPLIMDSLFDTVLSHDKLTQYIPHYSVNETTRWAHIMPIGKNR